MRTARAALLLAAALLGCQEAPESIVRPTDLDRQCEPNKGEMACREGLLCIRLFIPKVLSDGGIGDSSNYTCHPACQTDEQCLKGYRCYRPMPPPMQAVCVRAEVVDRLQPDGGM